MRNGLILGWIALVGMLSFIILSLPAYQEKIPFFGKPEARTDRLVDSTVLIEAGANFGSGFVIQRGNTQFVWTVAHVLESLEKMEPVVDPGADRPRLRVSYLRPKVVRMERKKGIPFGERFVYADILRYSDSHQGQDIALLRTTAPIAPSSTSLSFDPPPLGQPVLSVGSPHGREGYNSVIPGFLSALGRSDRAPSGRIRIYDQYALPITSGCSGGPVFDLLTGKVLGMASHVNKDNHSVAFFIPSRVIQEFARDHQCLWAVDPTVPLPSPSRQELDCPRVTPLAVEIKEKTK